MSKRTADFERRPLDTYDTPFSAFVPLVPHLPKSCYFIEPCAGKGQLVDHLKQFGHTCELACDIEPRRADIRQGSAFALRVRNPRPDLLFITNPPWARSVLHPLIRHLAGQLPTWLLFEADWFQTKQASALLPICHKMVAVGRVKWIEGSDHVGFENASWYFFDGRRQSSFVEAYGR